MLATGHGMLGISLAPVTGRLVADAICGNSPLLNIEPLSLDRFN
jgi:D-amino-acid dehydrogenase